ncbi:glycosyltransferase family 9 protein [Desulfonatronum parangueonense]
MAWPAMWNIRARFANSGIYWIGPQSRLPWLRPLGVQPCPPDLQRIFDSLFGLDTWPEDFGETRLFWFVLDARPPVPEHPNLHVLPGIPRLSGAGQSKTLLIPPRDSYLQHLAHYGIQEDGSWSAAWRELFGGRSGRTTSSSDVLLFPGAGHVAKQWPLVQFFELARWLEEQGRVVHFVLGPAELERGMDMESKSVICPDSLEELQSLIQQAELVVGNDCGPMHLAGMLGVPGVVLFGPASEKQWGPLGLRTVGQDLSCRPCTMTGRISCGNPACMSGITQDMVRREIEAVWSY